MMGSFGADAVDCESGLGRVTRNFEIRRVLREPIWRVTTLGVLSLGLLSAGVSGTQDAVANGDTRSLNLYHTHTRESLTVTFRRDGSYDRAGLEKLNWFLRDWRRDEPTNMDPRLFDTLWETYREVGSSEAVRVVSAYRSPETNSMLRRRSSGVAKHSQHTMGKAMDLHMPDVSMGKVREIGMRLHRGGVGYYPTAGTPFVHLDVGSVRSWPRMTRPQLERLFPDGKTVHLPADGKPLAGYEVALAEIQQRGGSAISYAEVTSPRRSLWAALFGGEDDEVEVQTTKRGGKAVASRPVSGSRGQQTALASSAGMDQSSVYAVNNAVAVPQVAAAQPVPARPATRPQPVEEKAAEAPRSTAVAAVSAPRIEAAKADRDADAPRSVTAPVPPRRPGDLTFAMLAAAAVPVPPVRPADEPQVPAQQLAAVSDPAPKLANVPLPAPRPTAFAAASDTITGAVDRSALPAAIAGGTSPAAPPVTAFAPANVPVPPVRPAIRSPQPQAETAPGKYALKLDTGAMNALMTGVSASEDKPRSPQKVELPGVRQSLGTVIVAGKFSQSAGAESGRFSGGLVRPLGAGFVKRGE